MAERGAQILAKTKAPVMTLNKKLIIALACIVAAIFLAIIINALSSPTHSGNANPHAAATNPQNLQTALAPVNNLPADYGAADQIDTIMMRGIGGPAIQKLLSSLQAQQTQLQQQLAALKNQPQNQNNQYSAQASSSSIFFAGGAPAPTQPQAATTPATAAKSATGNTPGANTSDTYAQQNMQGQKLDFITSQPNKDIYNNNTVQYPASPYILQAGSVVPAVLQTTISTDLPGVITAIVTQDVFDSITGKYLLIPRGSRLIGEYNSTISYGQTQVQSKFTRLIRPDGTSIVLPNQPGVNGVGTSGLSDEVNNHMGKIIGAGVLAALFNIPGIIATNQMNSNTSSAFVNGQWVTTNQSVGSVAGASALQGVGQSASNIGNALANKSLNIQPTLIINAGYQFSVMVTKDIVLPPYSVGNSPKS
jgi:type IV secretion system protein TrbI